MKSYASRFAFMEGRVLGNPVLGGLFWNPSHVRGLMTLGAFR